MYAVVAGSKSKYATLAGARLLIGTVSLEVFFALAFLAVYLHVGGFAFEDLAGAARRAEPLLGALPPLGCFFLLYVLFEAKRAPFDHSEAESELVAGHMVEFGGRSFLFFLAAEYLHLILGVFLLLLLVVGEGFPLWVLVSWPFWADLIGGVALAL
jgi:NADH-quinone oxidoreductase subunit H